MLDPTTLSSLKVTELKAELKKRGLPVGGLKQALVDRLAEDIIKEQEKQNAPEALEEPAPAEENAQQTNGHATAEVESAVVETLTPEEPVQVQERAKSPKPVVEPEPARTEPVQVQAREPSPEVEPAQEPSPEPEPVEEQLPPPQVETEQVETEQEEPQQEVVPEAQDSPRPEAVELEVAAEVAEPAQHDVQEQVEHKEPPAENKEPNLPTEEMQIDAATAKTPEEATPASIEPEKPQEHNTDEDASMSEAPVPTEAPKSLPPTETQSSMAIAEEITVAITSQSDLAVPPATAEPMDTREDSSTDLRKRKRRSDSPPPPTDTEDAAAPTEETPVPAVEEEEEGSISKKPRQASPPPKPRQRDARFKGLFNNGETLPSAEPDLADDAAKRDSNANGDEDDEPPVKASIHPATRALYIRNLVRPINEPLLRQHLTTLAAGPTGGAEQIEFFFVDAIKSHALIIFASLTAATRVRVGVHGKVWPNERTRKPLWVDFVPEEKVQGWVDTEKKGGRWQVAFNEDESVEGGIRAELEEVGAGGGRPVRGGRGVELLGAPTGPRGDRERKNSVLAVQKSAPISVPADAATARQARVVDLDELFKSTRTKPKLYYMPVSEEIARERLAGQRRDSRGRH